MVDSIRCGGYFNLRNIDLRLLHSLTKTSGKKMRDDEHELTLFSGVSFCTCCQRDFDIAVRGLCLLLFCEHVLLADFL